MPFPYVYYSRKNLNATEIQFFDVSRAEAAGKERETNLPKKLQLDKPFICRRIMVQAPHMMLSSATARDTALDDNALILLNEACLVLQIGDGPVWYFPVAMMLGGPEIDVALAYTLAAAADGSYGLLHVNGKDGLPVEIEIPANTDIKCFITTTTTPAINPVTVYLIGEHP